MPEDGFELALVLGSLPEPLPDVLERVLEGLDEVLVDWVGLEPLGSEPMFPMYGQGLQLGYEKPHVCPRRHVQARPATGSRGQFWIPVHVLPPEPGLDGPGDYVDHAC